MDESLRLLINGREQVLEGLQGPAVLAAVLDALALRADRVAVELNGELAPRRAWAETVVRSGDRLEVVHFVGGGSQADGELLNCRREQAL